MTESLKKAGEKEIKRMNRRLYLSTFWLFTKVTSAMFLMWLIIVISLSVSSAILNWWLGR